MAEDAVRASTTAAAPTAGPQVVFLARPLDALLDHIEHVLRMPALEGIDARTSWAAPAALKGKELCIKSVTPQAPQWPVDRLLPFLAKKQ